MKDKDIDYLILQYLKKKGYDTAERVFRHHFEAKFAQDGEEQLNLSHQLDSENGLQDLLFHYAAEENPKHLVDSFDQLVAWADSSLDVYRVELQRVLYPVFVHVYLQLVQYGASHTAADLLKKYRRRLAEVAGRQSSSVRAQELQELQAVAVAQHLDAHPFAKAARASRSTLVLSSYSFELLMHYLQSQRQWLLLNILNSHVRFELHDGLPVLDGDVGDGQGTGLLQGRAGQDAGAINATAIDLGLLRDGVEDIYAAHKLQEEEEKLAKQTAAGAANAAAAAAAAEEGVIEAFDTDYGQEGTAAAALSAAAQQASAAQKRLKAVRDKAAAAAKAKQKDILESRRMPMIPLLPAHETLKSTQRADLEARTTLSPPDQLPSCCFFNILNSRQGLTALSCSADTKLLAAGFSDSMVRLYDLEKLGMQRKRLAKAAAARAAGTLPHGSVKRGKAVSGHFLRGEQDLDIDMEEQELMEELADMSQQQTTSLIGHSNTVNALAFSADQQLLFSASSDSTVRLWSTELRKGLAAYRGHVFPVWDVAASPHGCYLVSGGSDRTARLWSTEHARPLRIFAGHQSDVDVVAWHPNSHYVATGSSDRTVRLWDVASGSCVRLITAQGCPTALALSPDGTQLAAGTEDGSIGVYDLATARRLSLMEGHQGPVWSMAYSHGSGSLLATGGADRTLRLYSMPHTDNIVEVIDQELAAAAAAGDGGDVTAAAGAAGRAAGGGSAAVAAVGPAAVTAGRATAGAGTGVPGHGHAAQQYPPYQLLKVFTTQATPVTYVNFSPRNLLLAGGPWTLLPMRQQQQSKGAVNR